MLFAKCRVSRITNMLVYFHVVEIKNVTFVFTFPALPEGIYVVYNFLIMEIVFYCVNKIVNSQMNSILTVHVQYF